MSYDTQRGGNTTKVCGKQIIHNKVERGGKSNSWQGREHTYHAPQLCQTQERKKCLWFCEEQAQSSRDQNTHRHKGRRSMRPASGKVTSERGALLRANKKLDGAAEEKGARTERATGRSRGADN